MHFILYYGQLVLWLVYVATKATYIRLLHGKIGFFFWGGGSALAPSKGVGPI